MGGGAVDVKIFVCSVVRGTHLKYQRDCKIAVRFCRTVEVVC